jgi:ribosome-binding protein aMBF1 (putative translation factor)
MAARKTLGEWLAEKCLSPSDLAAATRLDDQVIAALVHRRYTPSPEQRRRVAEAIGVSADEIAWGHEAEVEHLHGHGPQFGRTP